MHNTPPSAPSLPNYYRKVWQKARQLESGHWVRRVVGDIVPSVTGALLIAWTLGLSEAIGGERIGFALAGLALLVLGAARFFACLLQAPMLIDAENQAQIENLRSQLEESAERVSQRKREAASIYYSFTVLAARKLSSEDELGQWKVDFQELKTKALNWTGANFGIEETQIRFNGHLSILNIEGSINEEHRKLLSEIHEFYYPAFKEFAGKQPT